MTKTYVARSQVSFSVVIGRGTVKRVRFVERIGGGSSYTTSNAAEQQAIERHSNYNKTFRLLGVVEEKRHEEKSEGKKKKMKTVRVASKQEAAHYMKEEYKVPLSKMRTAQNIKDIANSLGIEFEGI